MPVHVVPTDRWAKTNLAPGAPAGHVRVREAISLMHRVGKYIALNGVYSLRPQNDDMVRTYTVESLTTTNIVLKDEDDVFSADTQVAPAGNFVKYVSWALVNGLLFCASPDFATHYAYQGGNMWEAKPEDDADDGFTTLEIPRGICVEWAGRLVVAADDVIYFANPGAPFTFLSVNVIDPPGGSIRGLHNVDGTLVVCTTNGTYGLPIEAAQRREVAGGWQRLSSYRCMEYGQTLEKDGTVWGVTERGLSSIFPVGVDAEINQSEGMRWYGERFSSRNWRAESKLVSLGSMGVGLVSSSREALFVLNPEEGFGSWWATTGNYLNVAGAGFTSDGSVALYYAEGTGNWGFTYRLTGNRSETETTVKGSLSGSTREHTVDASPVMRKVQFATDLAGDGNAFLAVQSNALKTATPPARGVVAGTSVWGGTDKLQEKETRSRAFNTSFRSDSHELEVGLDEANALLRTDLIIHFHGIGPKRETN